ncbi:putative F-box/LRR-repeat protein at5g41840 [Phtheirospermum japonicum]|uniref:Putative F-box/LRR-repeat protein at5g41840 n=1 Tax=Phtheirospermum japonicum TaxID=374723 RepID=A0A830C358_9LAMI|nr:putative F-box/LRR-repeat protein at5g41840 [Phtheirospermum japonicum]
MERTRQSIRNSPSIDRLSALPEGIICHILSFLPTKTSLSTSILARRWRFLWARVPNLNFDSTNHQSETSFSSIITRNHR